MGKSGEVLRAKVVKILSEDLKAERCSRCAETFRLSLNCFHGSSAHSEPHAENFMAFPKLNQSEEMNPHDGTGGMQVWRERTLKYLGVTAMASRSSARVGE